MTTFTPPNYIINIPRIKVSTDINYSPTNLCLGELSYGFTNNTLFVGSPDVDSPPTVIISDTKINNLIAIYFDNNLTSHLLPILSTKADLNRSNIFMGMNQFPYLKISTSAPSQQHLPATIKMIKEYVEGKFAELGLIQNVQIGIYQHLENPLAEIIIVHNKHTVNFDVIEILEVGTDNTQIAPITIIDDNSFKLTFNYPILLSLVKVIFYIGNTVVVQS